MSDGYSREKVIESIFDPNTSEILAELENGGKELLYLTEKLSLSENLIRERLAYLLQHHFVIEKKIDEKIIFSADAKKLAEVVEEDKNFDGVVDGLTEMDSFLN